MTLVDALGRNDFFRFDAMEPTDARRKEWHHFVAHGDPGVVIINFSVAETHHDGRDRLEPRLVVLVHHAGWEGWVAEVDPDRVALDRGGLSARFDRSSVVFDHWGYDVALDLPEHRIRGRLRFTPASDSLIKHNRPLGDGGRMSWLVVPRLTADGHLWVGNTRMSLRRAPAYHDHNWGTFSWGGDFGWEWGSVLPRRGDGPWAFVYWRMTDRTHTATRGQGLLVWHDRTPVAMFRDSMLEITTEGHLRGGPQVVVPPAMRLLEPGQASDVPRKLQVVAERGSDRVEVVFSPRDFSRLVVPAETSLGANAVLHEVGGAATAVGVIKGEQFAIGGTGVFELLR